MQSGNAWPPPGASRALGRAQTVAEILHDEDPVTEDEAVLSDEEGTAAERKKRRFAYRPGLIIVDGGQWMQ